MNKLVEIDTLTMNKLVEIDTLTISEYSPCMRYFDSRQYRYPNQHLTYEVRIYGITDISNGCTLKLLIRILKLTDIVYGMEGKHSNDTIKTEL